MSDRSVDLDKLLPLIEPYFDQAMRTAKQSIEQLLPPGRILSMEVQRPDSMTLLGIITAPAGNSLDESNNDHFIKQGSIPKRLPPFTKSPKIKKWVEHKLDSHFGRVDGPSKTKRNTVVQKLTTFIETKIESIRDSDNQLEQGFSKAQHQSEAIISQGISEAMGKIFE